MDEQESASYTIISNLLATRSAKVYGLQQAAKSERNQKKRLLLTAKADDMANVIDVARDIFIKPGQTYREKEERIKAFFFAARDAGYWED